jgi:ADP-heptose:LPS heptosyltransferase
MQAEAFDLALQMHGAGAYSNPFVLNLGARYSVGLKAQHAVPLERWIPYIYYQNEVVRALEVAALAGASAATRQLQPRLPVLESDLQAAAPALERIRAPFVVVHPGSTDPRRCWSPEKFAAVADACAANGLQVVLTGTQMEAERIQATAAAMRAPAINLLDQLSLPGLVGLLSRAALFVGNDSGPLHLALAAGTRAVGLFWVEYILNSLPLLRENFYPLIAWQRSCPLCGCFLDKAEADNPSGACKHGVSMIEEITPASVIAGVEALLAVP